MPTTVNIRTGKVTRHPAESRVEGQVIRGGKSSRRVLPTEHYPAHWLPEVRARKEQAERLVATDARQDGGRIESSL
jgi:hypothetical protein